MTYEGKGSFGELALLYNMPRAATVQVQVHAIVPLHAIVHVQLHATVHVQLHATVHERLHATV